MPFKLIKNITTTLIMFALIFFATACFNQKKVSSIEINSIPFKITYDLGEELNLEGGKIKVNYSNAEAKEISMTNLSVSVSGFDNSSKGVQEITISYKGFSKLFNIYVGVRLISFNSNCEEQIEDAIYEPGDLVEIPEIEKDGFSFEGWYCDSDFDELFNFVMPNENLTVYARFIEGENVKLVGGENAHYETITEAVSLAENNDIIFVRAGEYTESFSIEKSITLLGNNYDKKGYEQRRSESVIYAPKYFVADFNRYESEIHVAIASSNVIFSGFKLDGDNPEIENPLTETMQSLFSSNKTSNGWWSYHREGLALGQDLEVDANYGIEVAGGSEHFSGIKIFNNYVTNYNSEGIIIASSSTKASTGVGCYVYDNYIVNIFGYGVTYGTTTYANGYGCFGNGILASGAMASSISGNKIENANTGVHYTYVNALSEKHYIFENEIKNTATGIWINSNDEKVSANIEILVYQNKIYHDGNFVQRLELNTKETLGIENSYGIVVTFNSANFDILIFNNEIFNLRYGVAAANNKDKVVYVYENNFHHLHCAVALLSAFTMYRFDAYNSYVIAYNNIKENCEYDHDVYEVNTGKIVELYLIVEFYDGDMLLGTLEVNSDDYIDANIFKEKEGYEFEGWYEDEELTIPYSFVEPVNTKSKNVVYGKWVQI